MSVPERDHHRLTDSVRSRVRRMKKAAAERPTIFAQTVYLGTLGLVFVLPVVAGAYLGSWLDERLQGYSFSWTLTMILLGVFVGAVDAYLLIRE